MYIFSWVLLTAFVLASNVSNGQKLRKSDRQIVANIQTHLKNLGGEGALSNPGSQAEKLAGEYISRQFAKAGLKPAGDSNSYIQKVVIFEGKEILPQTYLRINKRDLKLHEEYFPLPFSASKSAEAAVAIPLAENGVPWFKDMREIIDMDGDSLTVDTLTMIRERAIAAAGKGASALIIYGADSANELTYDGTASGHEVPIPVIYLRNGAFGKYCSDESEIIDVALQVSTRRVSRTGINVVAFADNKADSTIIAGVSMGNEEKVAALLEIARVMKATKTKTQNYLFVAYCEEENGTGGSKYYSKYPRVDPATVSRNIALDTVDVSEAKHKTLFLVKQSVDVMRK